MIFNVDIHSALGGGSVLAGGVVHLAGRKPPPPESDGQPDREISTANNELAYRVELWNAERTAVERVLAVASSVSIGYAAYYAALQDFPDRHITYRHSERLIAQSNVSKH